MSRQRPALRILAIGLALLGLCVFAWGLRYKLSLYDPPGAQAHRMPAAKLLTGNERRALPVAEVRPQADPASLAVLTAFAFAALLLKRSLVAPAFAHSLLGPSRRRTLTARVPWPASFIRPPPRLR